MQLGDGECGMEVTGMQREVNATEVTWNATEVMGR